MSGIPGTGPVGGAVRIGPALGSGEARSSGAGLDDFDDVLKQAIGALSAKAAASDRTALKLEGKRGGERAALAGRAGDGDPAAVLLRDPPGDG